MQFLHYTASEDTVLDIYAQGYSCGGKKWSCNPCVLKVLRVLHVAFVTQPTKAAFTTWMSCGCFVCFTDAIQKILGCLLGPVPKHQCQNTAVQRTMSLQGYLYLKTCFCSNPFHYIYVLEQLIQTFLFSPDPAEKEFL